MENKEGRIGRGSTVFESVVETGNGGMGAKVVVGEVGDYAAGGGRDEGGRGVGLRAGEDGTGACAGGGSGEGAEGKHRVGGGGGCGHDG